MAEKSSPPTFQQISAMPENEFLEICRDNALRLFSNVT